MPPLSPNILESVLRASKRSSAAVHKDMSYGLNSVATIASTAPLVGLLGTIWGILHSFHSCGEKSFCMAALAESLSESIWPTALGLLIGIVSLLFYKYLAGSLRLIDDEMENASLDLVDYLRHRRGPFEFEAPVGRVDDRPMFGEEPVEALRKDLNFWRWSISLAGTALVASWFVNAARYFYDYSLSLSALGLAALAYVIFTFGLSCFLAYPIWVGLLRRRRGGLAAVSAGFCVCWSVAKLIWGDRLP